MKYVKAIRETADLAQDVCVILICSSVIAALAILMIEIYIDPEAVLRTFQ